MFEETLRELRKLERGTRITIPIPLDSDGYLDRLCPDERCQANFKVEMGDWKDKVRDEESYCAFCRHAAPATEWNTPAQTQYLREYGAHYIAGVLDRTLAADAKRFNAQQRPDRSAFLSLSMSMSYRPGVRRMPLPPDATAELRQQFKCEECSCNYASLGASFFCPACGHSSAKSQALETVRIVQSAIDRVEAIERGLASSLDADAVRDLVRAILEDQFPRLVGAFERLAEAAYNALPNANARLQRGVFQRLDDASALWQDATGRDFGDRIGPSDFAELRLLFQKRHVLVHRQGIVDQSYIDRSGDTTYAVGQRLVVRRADVLRLAELICALATSLDR